MTHPSSLRALVVESPGASFTVTTLPVPPIGPGEMLVHIEASGVNPLDTKIRAGTASHARQPLPAVLGIDLAGTVVAVGASVDTFRPGDAVYGMAGGVGGLQGSLAERAVVDSRLIAHKPKRLSMREAAALPLAVITAWEGLVDRARVAAGQTVLVQGGAGGVGHIVVQLAKARGAQVFATASAEHGSFLRRLGAQPIDYRDSTVARYVEEFTRGEGFDVVYDTVGGATLDASFAAVRRDGGHVVSILGWGTHSLAQLSLRAATYSGVFTLLPMLTGKGRTHHGEILQWASSLVDAGQLTPALEPRIFRMEDALDAYRLVESGTARGKVVISISPRA